MSASNDQFSDDNMRDEKEERILKTIREKDVETLKTILAVPAGCRLGFRETPILLVAVMSGDCTMIKHLIDNGCDPWEVDTNGRSAWYRVLWWSIQDSDEAKYQSDVADILLAAHTNSVETVFLNADENKMTPFLLACSFGCDAIILRFLALLGTNAISMDHVIDNHGDNLFHHLLDDSCHEYRVFPPSVEIARAFIDKFPYSDQLVDAKNQNGETPLHKLLAHGGREVGDFANLFFQYGASPHTQDRNGTTYLEWAVRSGNASFVETLLRAGCRTYIFKGESPLFLVLKKVYLRSHDNSQSIRIIELLLGFGYDLQKDLFLYDEPPIEFPLLETLKKLRRSNKMFSLQRQCRNTIRRHLKVKADEVIGNLDCIPDRIKSFLLVQNEMPLLE